MDVQRINRDIGLLVSNITFSADYNYLCTGAKSLLLVEGLTDEKFIKPILKEKVVCKIANKAFGNKQTFEKSASFNCKNAIVNVVYGLSKAPKLLDLPKGIGIENLVIYGMVDLDFDEPDATVLSGENLFVTDTHDLETLLLSTDHELLEHLDECSITCMEAKQAFYLAYQFGFIRQVLHDICGTELELGIIAGGRQKDINYDSFVEGNVINLKKIIEYVAANSKKTVSKEKIKKLLDKCLKEKAIKKKINNDFQWAEPIEKFEISAIDDFWKVTNGHDILSIIRFLNKEANEKYSANYSNALNRKFENDLIKAYNYRSLENTKIYQKMRDADVVVELL